MKNLLITLFVTLFFLSNNAISADYSQNQNKVDDKMNSPKPTENKKLMDEKRPDSQSK